MVNDKPRSYEYYMLKGKNVCNSFKWGEYNGLRCCDQLGHTGEHNYVVVKEIPVPSEARRTQQKLFTELGTLHRTMSNLINIADRVTDKDQKIALSRAIIVILQLIASHNTAMKTIPKPQPKSNSTKPKKEPHWTDTVGRF